MSKVLGVLGGMGPAATLDFLAKLQAATPVVREQDHIRVLVDINPKVPDRNTDGDAAGPVLAAMAAGLRDAGAEVLAIACNTAHAFAEQVKASGLPLIDLPETAVEAARVHGATRIGVLGTGSALSIYRDRLSHLGLEAVSLGDHEQVEFMALLYRIKRGDLSDASRQTMAALAHRLIGLGAQAVVAGCTEVPLVMGQDDLTAPFVDATQALAQRCVAICR
ncbi:aspartate racemase [Caulobacter sp. D4A]|uniref:aspartate/glutamate racemase family protein n=1 Tax=unclassified Caulobacter TaxID=2648921 RepID=UPI000D72DBBF|nr:MULTISPECIES: amino acid racemase [unclassified Caulobacter]PXA82625.1 aspartate racemase [Caulobacter sp. D4A]PXA86607.1 aspartate racemase [Caulobacter sp. D5]